MRDKKRVVIRKGLVVLCLAFLALAPAWAKKRYQVEQIAVDALVERDGDLRVEERIRYRFQGSFSYSYREIHLKPGEVLDEVSVSEGGTPYSLAGEESPGTFAVSREGDRVQVAWYFKARNETRTFALSYRMRNVVRRHLDTAELEFQFVGDGWDRSVGDVSAVVRFEAPVSAGELRAWAHGPLYGEVEPPSEGSVRFRVSPLPARTFFEGRVLFPVSLAPGAAETDEAALDRILTEERGRADEANRLRAQAEADRVRRAELTERFLPWSILVALASLSVWIFLYFSHGKPYPPQRSFPVGEPPGELPPALAAYLIHRDVGGSAIAATMIDLARRGFLKIEETEKERSGWFGPKKKLDYRFERTDRPLSEAADYERDLVEFAVLQTGDGQGVWLSEFKKTAAQSRGRFLKWFRAWKKQVKELGGRKGFFEPFTASALAPNLACGLGATGAGIYFCVASMSPVGVPAIVLGTVQMVLSLLLTRRTPEGQDLYRAWKKFKAHVKSIAKGLGPPSLDSDDWSRYLVASIVLGLHRDFTKRMDISTDPELARSMAWYVPHSDHSGLGGFGASVSSMVSSVGTAVSSAAGTGGGASAGGGGGSGGGGGGAG